MVDTQKLKVLVGNFHVEYEGNLKDLVEHLPGILEISSEYMSMTANSSAQADAEANDATNVIKMPQRSGKINSTTNAIATRMGCKSCSELALAAAANLHFAQGKLEFSRKEIMTEMQSAKGFYKPSFRGSNLGDAFKKLLSDNMLNECGKDKYALCAPAIASLEAKLAAA